MRYIFIFLTLSLASGANAQSIEGRWLSDDEWGGLRSVVEIVPCAQGFCGTIVETRGTGDNSGIIGHRIMWDFYAKDEGGYTKGKLKPPGGAPQLSATLTMENATVMKLRACFLLVCQNQILRKI